MTERAVFGTLNRRAVTLPTVRPPVIRHLGKTAAAGRRMRLACFYTALYSPPAWLSSSLAMVNLNNVGTVGEHITGNPATDGFLNVLATPRDASKTPDTPV